MDINTLNNLWVEAGHNVEDLNEQINNALNDDNFSAEAFADLKDKRDNAKARRDALKGKKSRKPWSRRNRFKFYGCRRNKRRLRYKFNKNDCRIRERSRNCFRRRRKTRTP